MWLERLSAEAALGQRRQAAAPGLGPQRSCVFFWAVAGDDSLARGDLPALPVRGDPSSPGSRCARAAAGLPGSLGVQPGVSVAVLPPAVLAASRRRRVSGRDDRRRCGCRPDGQALVRRCPRRAGQRAPAAPAGGAEFPWSFRLPFSVLQENEDVAHAEDSIGGALLVAVAVLLRRSLCRGGRGDGRYRRGPAGAGPKAGTLPRRRRRRKRLTPRRAKAATFDRRRTAGPIAVPS